MGPMVKMMNPIIHGVMNVYAHNASRRARLKVRLRVEEAMRFPFERKRSWQSLLRYIGDCQLWGQLIYELPNTHPESAGLQHWHPSALFWHPFLPPCIRAKDRC